MKIQIGIGGLFPQGRTKRGKPQGRGSDSGGTGGGAQFTPFSPKSVKTGQKITPLCVVKLKHSPEPARNSQFFLSFFLQFLQFRAVGEMKVLARNSPKQLETAPMTLFFFFVDREIAGFGEGHPGGK